MSCQKCGVEIYCDFNAKDETWALLPKEWQNTALCINCFTKMIPNGTELLDRDFLFKFIER